MCEGDSVGDGDDGSGFSDSDDSPTTTIAITSPLNTVSTPLPPQSVTQLSSEDPINSDHVDVAVTVVSDAGPLNVSDDDASVDTKLASHIHIHIHKQSDGPSNGDIIKVRYPADKTNCKQKRNKYRYYHGRVVYRMVEWVYVVYLDGLESWERLDDVKIIAQYKIRFPISTVRIGVCTLTEQSRGVLVDDDHLEEIFLGKFWEFRKKIFGSILGDRVGLVSRGSGGQVVGEATIAQYQRLTLTKFVQNSEKHMYKKGWDDYSFIWVLENVVRYDKIWLYDHKQGSQTPCILYNLSNIDSLT